MYSTLAILLILFYFSLRYSLRPQLCCTTAFWVLPFIFTPYDFIHKIFFYFLPFYPNVLLFDFRSNIQSRVGPESFQRVYWKRYLAIIFRTYPRLLFTNIVYLIYFEVILFSKLHKHIVLKLVLNNLFSLLIAYLS